MILAIRTDNPEAELVLCDVSGRIMASKTWQAHRQLAETLHQELEALLLSQAKTYADIQGIVIYHGPGSFTGLRIGVSVANALAYAQGVPIVGTTGEQWIDDGVEQILHNPSDEPVWPEYGAPVHITTPRK